MSLTPFHVAVPVRDIDEARHFYGKLLGFAEGRSAAHWIDFDMFGHQFVVHLDSNWKDPASITNPVDGEDVPVPHCGVVLSVDEWESFRARIEPLIDEFVISPYVRFKDEPGEQHTMFFLDPSGNALEFKAFQDIEGQLFKK